MEDTTKNLSELTKHFRQLNLNGKTEEKSGLTYLSWSWAIEEALRECPDMTYEVKKFDNSLPYVYDSNTGYMVFTSVTMKGVTREAWLFVMNGANKAMKAEKYSYLVKDWDESKKQGKHVDKAKWVEPATMFDINTTIMRCLVKNLAMFGLGLYIYHGASNPEALKLMDNTRFEGAIKALEENKTTKAAILAFDLTHEQTVRLDAVKITETVADKLKKSVNN